MDYLLERYMHQKDHLVNQATRVVTTDGSVFFHNEVLEQQIKEYEMRL